MKRTIIAFLILMAAISTKTYGTNRFLINAANITTGGLPNARLDGASVTLQGNSISLTNLDARINNLEISTGAVRTPWNITIGTLTALGVDIASNTDDGLREAVRRLTGLTGSTSGYGSILYKTGTYMFSGATVPNGVNIYALDKSSTIWKMTNTSSGIAVCYGNIDGITFSFDNLAWTSVGVEASSGCKITNMRVVDASGMSSTAGVAVFRTRLSTKTYVAGEFVDYLVNASVNPPTQQSSPVQILDSQEVTYSLRMSSPIHRTSSGNAFHIQNSSDVYIQDSTFYGVGGRFLHIANGTRRVHYRRNTFYVEVAGQSSGHLSWVDDANTVSSGTFITDNTFIYRGTAGTQLLVTGADTKTEGLVISRNIVQAEDSTESAALFTINAGTTRAILADNVVIGAFTFISDSGKSTQYTTLGNFRNGVQQ